MPNSSSLAGKTALITGGTRGVGRAISLQFARSGARVLANFVRDQKAADDLESIARSEGLALTTCRADLTNETGQQRLMEAVGALEPLTTFVHCAASGVHRPVDQLTARHFDFTFALNVRAFLQLTVALLPRFAPPASIIAVSSEGAHRAVPHYTLVGSSKGALESMVRHFAAELAPRNIRVNALAPGTVLTDAWKTLPDAQRRLDDAAKRSPIGRLVSLDEVARAAQFLASDASSGIIGHTLVVDVGSHLVS